MSVHRSSIDVLIDPDINVVALFAGPVLLGKRPVQDGEWLHDSVRALLADVIRDLLRSDDVLQADIAEAQARALGRRGQ